MANRIDGFRLHACVWISSETLEAARYRYKMQKIDKFETLSGLLDPSSG